MSSNPTSESASAKDAGPETKPHSQQTTPLEPGNLSSLTFQPGARPLPDYELVRKLGEGGFGEVWHARGPGGLDVALKFIRLEARGSALEVRSLDVMKTIRHPNLVSLFGAWQKDNVLILAMELCDCSLQDRLREALEQKLPGIPPRELLNYMRDAAAGLDLLNEQNVQHRDVKPGNLLLLSKGVKVADFGLAKVLEKSVASNTGAMTPAYTTPECYKGQIARQSDQYSLAMTYYHLRMGHLLFTGSFEQVMYRHLTEEPNLAVLPEAERAVVARALSKDPEKRWRNCKMFVNELVRAFTTGSARPADSAPTAKGSTARQDRVTSVPVLEVVPASEATVPLLSPARDEGTPKKNTTLRVTILAVVAVGIPVVLGMILLVSCIILSVVLFSGSTTVTTAPARKPYDKDYKKDSDKGFVPSDKGKEIPPLDKGK